MAGRSVITPFGGLRLIRPPETLTAAASDTIQLPSGLTEVRLVYRGSGGMAGGSPIRLQFNGDTGNNYLTNDIYGQGGAGPQWNAPGASGRSTGVQLAITGSVATVRLHMDVLFSVPKLDGEQHVLCQFASKGTTDATFIQGVGAGCWDQTAADVSVAVVAFGSPFTGRRWVYGQ